MRKQIVTNIVSSLKNLKKFKNIYKNIVPIWTEIPRFPAVSVLYESEEKERNSNQRFVYNATVIIYIFNKQNANEFEDILSDYIDDIYKIVAENQFLKCNTIDCSVASMKREGGIVHPYSIAQLKINIKYLQSF